MQITASVNYHVRKDEPQAFEFNSGGVIGNLISPELETRHIQVEDVRHQARKPAFGTDGIVFVYSPSTVSHFDTHSNWKHSHERELRQLLEKTISAVEIIVFDHTVRIDDTNAVRRPARNVHNDYNRPGAEQRLIDIVGNDYAQRFHDSGFGFVNVWRPVEHTILSLPLGFIHPTSMRPDDWMDIDLIYPDRTGHILGVAASKAHQWFYMSEMSPDEAAIFNIYDNRGRPHLAHSALDLPTDADITTPRKSIESRTLVRYR